MEANLSQLSSLEQEAVDEGTSSDRLRELTKISIELARLVANNPSAPPELLQELAVSSDATIRENIAANPNIPTEILLKLGVQFPKQILENPIFSLLLLENPNLPAEMPLATLRSLVTLENLPELFLVECATRQSDKDLLLGLTMNPKMPQTALEKLTRSNYLEVAEAARLHVNWAGEMSEGWDEAAREVIQAIASNQSQAQDRKRLELIAKAGIIPAFVIQHWQKTKQHKEVLVAIAQSPQTNWRVLEQLLQNEDEEIHQAIAQNPNTPRDISETLLKQIREKLVQMGMSTDVALREKAAGNPLTPKEVLEILAQDKSCIRNDQKPRISIKAAHNPNTPVKALEKMAQDPDPYYSLLFGATLCHNCNLSADDVLRLSENERFELLLASHPNMPIARIEQLANNRKFHKQIARNPSTPAKILEQIFFNSLQLLNLKYGFIDPRSHYIKVKNVCEAIAENPNISSYLLEILSADDIESIPQPIRDLGGKLFALDRISLQVRVARNPTTPVAKLEQFVNLRYVRESLLNNPNLPECLLEQLLGNKYNELAEKLMPRYLAQNSEGLLKLLLLFAKFNSPFVTIVILLYPQAPTDLLTERSRSSVWLERYAVAQNLSTPIDALNILANDGNRVVRATAKANLQERSQQP